MSELITRWQTPNMTQFHQAMKESLENGTFQGNSSPFGQFNGRWDFRGYDFYRHRFVYDCHFENVDLTLTNFTHCKFHRSKFINTIFGESTFYDFSEHGCVFDNCKFIKASLHFSFMGYDGSKYNRCVFDKCQFRRMNYIRAEFTRCQFVNNNLNGTEFGSSSFEDCVFTGKVKNVWFRGGYILPEDEQSFGKAKPNPMTVSFEDAELICPTFSVGCDLSKVILPRKGVYYRFDHWKERLDHVVSIVSEWEESENRKNILQWIDAIMPRAEDQYWMILNEADYIKQMGEVTAKKYLALLSEI